MKQLISIALVFVVCVASMACSGIPTGTPTPVEFSSPCGTVPNLDTQLSPNQQSVPSQSAPIPPRGNQAQIAFVSDRSGDQHVYLMNADGSGLADLTNYPGDHGFPVWAPDGNSLIYIRDGNGGFALKRVDGTQVDLSDGSAPAWSPDGKHTAFITGRDTRATPFNLQSEIYLMNADGTNQARLGFGEAPAWSPDGKQIAYVDNVHMDGQIYVMASDGSRARGPFNDRVSWASEPAWSPDGSMILYSSQPNSPQPTSDIYVTASDGSSNGNGTKLASTAKSHWDLAPAWSPDGKKIAFFRIETATIKSTL